MSSSKRGLSKFNWALRERMYQELVKQGIDPKIATYAAIGYFRIVHGLESIPRSMRKHFEDDDEEVTA